MDNPFDLKPAEIPTPITFREGGRKFRVTHVFRPPEFADWMEYEKTLNSSVELAGLYTRFDQARAEASEALWDRCILRVEGYLIPQRTQGGSTAEGAERKVGNLLVKTEKSLASSASSAVEIVSAFPDDWETKVPLTHKVAAVMLLAQVSVDESESIEEYCFDPDVTEVRLIAARGGRESSGLVHTLRRPTVRQQKEFSRVVSTALYVRGSRTQKSLVPSRLREMCRLYDELIVEARGYCPGSAEFGLSNSAALSREDAIRYMDALHKKVAVSALFSLEESEPPDQEEPQRH